MSRSSTLTLALLVLAALASRDGRSEEPRPPCSAPPACSPAKPMIQWTLGAPFFFGAPAAPSCCGECPSDHMATIYSLNDLSSDPEFGAWIADIIPEMVAPGSWKGHGVLRYYAPKNILVVHQTPAIQAEVAEFIAKMKKSLPGESDKKVGTAARNVHQRTLIPADFRAPALSAVPTHMPEHDASYPIPAHARSPKHLFHFIIRYEGEGIVDDNVVKAIKAQYQQDKSDKKEDEQPAPAASAPPAKSAPAPLASVPTKAPMAEDK